MRQCATARSCTIYQLSASRLAYIKSEGVPDQVIDYTQKTYLDAVACDHQKADWTFWVHE